jgi:hypothetical protein
MPQDSDSVKLLVDHEIQMDNAFRFIEMLVVALIPYFRNFVGNGINTHYLYTKSVLEYGNGILHITFYLIISDFRSDFLIISCSACFS